MLYFAFGSNLNRKQMKRRCKDSKYITCHTLNGYKLSFRNNYYGGGVLDGGVADIEKKQNGEVLGAIYKISKMCSKCTVCLLSRGTIVERRRPSEPNNNKKSHQKQ